MADTTSITKTAFDRSRWDRRVARWKRRVALLDADDSFGDTKKAERQHEWDRLAVEARFGSWERAFNSDEGKPLCLESNGRLNAASDRQYDLYTRPADRAAVLLALTPAPDLDAALLKIEVIKQHELDNYKPMSRDPMEVVVEDMRRIASAPERASA